MEGMRHKLSLPGLGMSKCTDPSRSPALQAAVCSRPCAVCRETRRHRLQSLEACARSRTAETRRAHVGTVRVENKCQMSSSF